MRDHNREYQDNESRRYAYDFDHVVRRYMMRTLSPFFTNGKALELGCFEGETTKLYAERFDDLTVIEAADSLIEIARTKVPASVRFIHSTIETAELEPVYGAIFLVHTLEHLDRPVEALSRIRAWLSPAGRLFVVVPNANAASRQIAVKMGLVETSSSVTEGLQALRQFPVRSAHEEQGDRRRLSGGLLRPRHAVSRIVGERLSRVHARLIGRAWMISPGSRRTCLIHHEG